MKRHSSRPLSSRWRSSFWLRAASVLACLLMINLLADGTSPIPSDKPNGYPPWWFERDVIPRLDSSNNAPLWNNHAYPAPDDYAVANLGQLKYIATQAAAELDAHLPGGAGSDIHNLVALWAAPAAAGIVRDDYAALNLGQLKAVAKLFYDRLIAVHYTSAYPWANGRADDFAVANLGQLKNVFSFDLLADLNGDGVPDWWKNYYQQTNQPYPTTPIDWWEQYYLGQDGIDPNSLAPSGDGMTLLQKFQAHVNPDLYQTVPIDQQSPVRLVVYTRLE